MRITGLKNITARRRNRTRRTGRLPLRTWAYSWATAACTCSSGSARRRPSDTYTAPDFPVVEKRTRSSPARTNSSGRSPGSVPTARCTAGSSAPLLPPAFPEGLFSKVCRTTGMNSWKRNTRVVTRKSRSSTMTATGASPQGLRCSHRAESSRAPMRKVSDIRSGLNAWNRGNENTGKTAAIRRKRCRRTGLRNSQTRRATSTRAAATAE